jgi:hypothetical protein
MHKFFVLGLLLTLVATAFLRPTTTHASDQITYISQPESVAIFLNNVAFVHDTISVASDAEVQIVLPTQVFQDTLVLREGEQRVPNFRINRSTGQVVIHLSPNENDTGVREISLDYLIAGLSWTPTYDMWIGADDAETVDFDFFVEIQNSALSLDDVDTRLVAGRVDTAQQISYIDNVTTNQYIAGYDDASTIPTSTFSTGPVTIQHVYPIGNVSALPGDTVYQQLYSGQLPARRVIIWNAPNDLQANIIYKVRNDSEIPLTQGIVRSYQAGLFVGSDFVETTPVGSEGSITVGGAQNLRVNRTESRTNIENARDRYDTQHEVTLTLSNFADDSIEVQVVDHWSSTARDFEFSTEPEREAANLFRWTVAVEAGQTLTITYRFKDES